MTQPQLQSFEHIGPAIRRLREARGLRQSDLAEMVKMNRASLSRLENGRVQPKPETVKKLLQALDVGETELAEAIEGVRRDEAASAAAFEAYRRRHEAGAEPGPVGAPPPKGDRLAELAKVWKHLVVLDYMQEITQGQGEEWLADAEEYIGDLRRIRPLLAKLWEIMRRHGVSGKSGNPFDDPEIVAELTQSME